jgi:HEPN domain-containing protein
MSKKSPTAKKRFGHFAVDSAHTFQRLAEVFITRIGAIKEESVPAEAWTTELGDLVACATNLALALELYQKAFLTELDLPVPEVHDLRDLYDLIPSSIGSDIELKYLACLKLHAPLWRRISLSLAVGPPEKPQYDESKKASVALPDLLARSRYLFLSWRYAFEFTQPEDSPYQFRTFEYAWLWCAAEAMRAEFTTRFRGRDDIARLPRYIQ